MAKYEHLVASDRGEGIIEVCFDLKNERVNKLSRTFMEDLKRVIDDLRGQKGVKVVLFTSAKSQIFIAGADIELIRPIKDPNEGEALAREAQEVIAGLETAPFASVAAIDGACLGGGLEFALCCSRIIASDRPELKLGLPEVNLGILPGMGGTVRLQERIGFLAALEWILSAKSVNAERAYKSFLIDAVLPHQDFSRRALEWVKGQMGTGGLEAKKRRHFSPGLKDHVLAGNPIGRFIAVSQARKQVLSKTKGHYPAPLKVLEVMAPGIGARDQALIREQKAFGQLAVTLVCKNLIKLFYSMESVKKKTGLLEGQTGKALSVERVGVLGAGVMGGGIAQLVAHRGMRVVLKDVQWGGLETAMKAAASLFQKQWKRRRLTGDQFRQGMERIAPTLDYGAVGACDVVVEAVVEKMSVKQQVLKECEAVLGTGAVFASNTSSLSVTELAESAKNRNRVVGMHFFNPVHKMPLVEVIYTSFSDPSATSTVYELAKRLGKTPVLVKDGPGFLVNRLLMPLLNEAMYLLEEGVGVEALDQALEQWGMPMGPGVLLDEIGLDTAAKVAVILHNAFGERAKPAGLSRRFEELKVLGKKGGIGFYCYDNKGQRQSLNEDLVRSLGLQSGGGPDRMDWIPRMIYPMINEAARCLQEGIVEQPEDVDLAMIMGTGFPPFRGGLLRFADELGLAHIRSELQRLAGTGKDAASRFAPSPALDELLKTQGRFYGAASELGRSS